MLYGHLLQYAEAWCCLAGVEELGVRALQLLKILRGLGSNATHALDDVE
jgi:hypothetical protein